MPGGALGSSPRPPGPGISPRRLWPSKPLLPGGCWRCGAGPWSGHVPERPLLRSGLAVPAGGRRGHRLPRATSCPAIPEPPSGRGTPVRPLLAGAQLCGGCVLGTNHSRSGGAAGGRNRTPPADGRGETRVPRQLRPAGLLRLRSPPPPPPTGLNITLRSGLVPGAPVVRGMCPRRTRHPQARGTGPCPRRWPVRFGGGARLQGAHHRAVTSSGPRGLG